MLPSELIPPIPEDYVMLLRYSSFWLEGSNRECQPGPSHQRYWIQAGPSAWLTAVRVGEELGRTPLRDCATTSCSRLHDDLF